MSLDAHSSPLDDSAGTSENSDEIPFARPAGHPLGPLLAVAPLESPGAGRLYAVFVAAVAFATLTMAVVLMPDARGMGTHRQLGLPPCGFMVVSGLPCPTCGMTTAFSLSVRGRILQAMQAQAAGFLLAVATAVAFVLAIFSAVTGRKVVLNWYRVSPTGLIWLAALVFLLAWGAKIVQGLATKSALPR